jgi:Cu-processing system permease protein
VPASFRRILAITLNTYREAVRARLLLGVFGLGLATCAYSLLVATLSLHNEARVVADLGSAALSLYGVIIAIVLGSTSLYRELEYKTVFPILSRPIRRWEYLVGKYFGTLLTVAVFIAIDAAAILATLALEADQPTAKVAGTLGALLVVLGLAALRARHARLFVVIAWAPFLTIAAWKLAWPVPEERQLVLASALLATCEVAIVTAIATLFASFSSPFLTATFTALLFIMGRSVDTMAHLPPKVFGVFASVFRGIARVVPNLHVYVPARPLLLGQAPGHPLWPYVATAAIHAVFYSTGLIVIGAMAFRRRDFS